MKRVTTLAVVVALVVAGSVLAGPPGKCGAQAAGKGCCPKSAQTVAGGVLGTLPQMIYKVGELETPCFETATEKAGADGKIECVVDGKTYECKREACAALASLLEKQLDGMMAVQYSVDGECVGCPNAAKSLADSKGTTVKYRLAGVEFDTQEKADAAAKAVHEAVARLAESKGITTCPKTGKQLASDGQTGCSKSCSKATTVAGTEPSGCSKGSAGAATAADVEPSGHSHGSAGTTTAAGTKSGCGSQTAGLAAGGESGCSKSCSKSATTVAGGKAGCCDKPGGCPNEDAEARVAQLQEMFRVMVETATSAQTS